MSEPMGKIKIKAATSTGLVIEPNSGGEITLGWKELAGKDAVRIACPLLQDDDVDAYLTVARLANKLGIGGEMDRPLQKLETRKPQSVSVIEQVRTEGLAQKTAAPGQAKSAPNLADPSGAKTKTAAPLAAPVAAVRVNQEGRQLSPLPAITKPVMFDTPEADAIVSAMQIFPVNNPWNEDISKLPVHKNSDAIVTSIGAGREIGFNRDMNYILVPPDQPRKEVKLSPYGNESDKGPYPIAEETPIEDWPGGGAKSLDEIQRKDGGDRHACVVDPIGSMIYEFYCARKTDAGWIAKSEATFDLRSNKTRPLGWTSTDAAGLPLFSSIPRFDECERGMVEHAMRFTVKRAREDAIWPATHFSPPTKDSPLPAMGQRLRLKADVNIDKFPKHAKAIALGLKKYGMFAADWGANWLISISPDRRLQGLEALHQLKGSDFEVVETTPEFGGPRAKSP